MLIIIITDNNNNDNSSFLRFFFLSNVIIKFSYTKMNTFHDYMNMIRKFVCLFHWNHKLTQNHSLFHTQNLLCWGFQRNRIQFSTFLSSYVQAYEVSLSRLNKLISSPANINPQKRWLLFWSIVENVDYLFGLIAITTASRLEILRNMDQNRSAHRKFIRLLSCSKSWVSVFLRRYLFMLSFSTIFPMFSLSRYHFNYVTTIRLLLIVLIWCHRAAVARQLGLTSRL